MGTDDARVWSETWREQRGGARPRWGFIFRRVARHVDFAGREVLELGAGEGNLGWFLLPVDLRHVRPLPED